MDNGSRTARYNAVEKRRDMIFLLWIRGILTHRLLRVGGSTAGVALTVGFIATMAVFLTNASTSMTSRAVSAVPIDWQVQVISGSDPSVIGSLLKEAARVSAVHRVEYA